MNREEFDVTLGDYLYARRRRQRSLIGGVLLWGGVALLLLSVICAISFADEKDVPSSARREIAMRGEQIERIDGQVRAFSDEDVIGQAAETPPDDSGKWHISILTVGNCQACQRLKSDLRGEAFRDWVNLDDHQRSWAHYHEIRFDGDVGREWGRKLEKFLRRKIEDFPAIVVQPPVNGSFGKHTELVFLQQGYDGDAEKLTVKMAEAMGKYCAKVKEMRMVARGGHRQEGEDDEEELGATPPPFLLSPTNPPPTSGLSFPQTIIPPRIAATIDQIKAACQGCDAEFLLTMISGQKTLEEVTQAWQGELLKRQIEELRKLKEKPTVTELKPTNPAAPAGFSLTTVITSIVATLLGTGGLGTLVVLGLQLFRRFRQASGKGTFLNDEQFAKLVEELKKVLGQPSPPAQS